ncbi:phospholipid methyltransferase [Oleiphilus sp. HI0078]|nr:MULTISPECIES: class I SAM-dependent methyltransferase [unclassified Oleiphilus]KZY39313.1 phospholipid methyltransferase [Oleiphilus sp. HI0043]KZY87356.1 phospholipid methyltransferase [Oleiphilus sp. HI0072]KZZ06515.1 phospholipid methyltransferase [Oleiphilus sp. HI0078]KZZ70692.1 phospholipid methyltransferase [Oleiphilus sp. HI0128]
MNLYEERILPHLINAACTSPPIQKLRKRIVPKCTGRVLEIGMGSGANLEFYNSKNIDFVWGLEPSEGMRRKAAAKVAKSDIEVKWLDLPGEEIPLEDDCVDTILLTFTLCTIPDYQKTLQQMHRVLKPEGKLLFSEHGLAPEPKVEKWQHRLNKPWGCVAGGCNLNRPIDKLIQAGGFEIVMIERFYAPKAPKFAGYIYLGEARKL